MSWDTRIITDKLELDALIKPWAAADKASKALLMQCQLHLWRGLETLVALDTDGTPVHIHVGHRSKQRRGAWGIYYNWVIAYTLPDYRRQGLARWTFHHQLRDRSAEGKLPVDRIKSLAGSKYGVLLHAGLGHHMWGATDKGELIVDSPWSQVEFPTTVPFHARTLPEWKDADTTGVEVRPMKDAEIREFFASQHGEPWPAR